MALWGNKDSKTASGTVAIASNGAVTGTGTSFTTQAKIGNTIRVAGVDYEIVAISSNTVCYVESGIQGGAIAAVSPAAAYTLSEKPAFVAASESQTTSGVAGDSNKVYGVDVLEAQSKPGVVHPGWVRRTEGTGGRAGRVFYETLVAGSTITGDQADDTNFPDGLITISVQPANADLEPHDTATFSVTASRTGTGSLSYQWQVNTGSGWNNFTVANHPDWTGETTATLSLTDAVLGNNGYLVRCVVSCPAHTTVNSNAATITVTA
jgi:hypothetical protein